MFSYLKGTVAEITENMIALEVGGVGYELAVSSNTASKLSVGDSVKMPVYLVVREDGVSLYGFLQRAEKNMFLRLTSVSGVGPKAAMAVLSGLSVSALAEAVSVGNLTALTGVKGIGKKTAEMIVVQLRDKIAEEFGGAGGGLPAAAGGAAQEAALALVSLGYSKAEAMNAVGRVANADKLSVEQIVLLSLKG